MVEFIGIPLGSGSEIAKRRMSKYSAFTEENAHINDRL
jgi:hypothetical protein